jgi:hypothetical protein
MSHYNIGVIKHSKESISPFLLNNIGQQWLDLMKGSTLEMTGSSSIVKACRR